MRRPQALRLDGSVQDGRAQAPLVLTDGAVGPVGAHEDDLPRARMRIVGLDDEIEPAVVEATRQQAGVAELRPGGREDQDAVVISIRQRLVAAKRLRLGDGHRVVAAGGATP